MIRLLSILVFVGLALPAWSAEYITATMTVTSAPSLFGASYTVNGSARRGTNTMTSTTWVTNATATGTATNIYSQTGLSPFSGGVLVTVSGSNVVFEGVALTASVTAGVGTLLLSTQSIGSQYSITVPFDNLSVTNRTNNADHLIYGVNKYGVSNFSQASRVLTNFVSVGLTQTVSNKAFNFSSATNMFLPRADITNAAGIGGTVTFVTNGVFLRPFLTNATADLRNGRASNLTVSVSLLTNVTVWGYGSYFSNTIIDRLTVTNLSAPGTGASSLLIGSGASATNDFSIAIGDSSFSGGVGSIALGVTAYATEDSSIALGTGSAATGVGAIAIGNNSESTALGSIALGLGASTAFDASMSLGYGAAAVHNSAVAIGTFSTTTESNQIMMGTSTFTVNVPGRLILAQCLTNVVLAGTNRTYALSYVKTNNSGFANGDNASVALGPYSYLKISGPTANYGIVGLAQGYDGRLITIQKNDAYTVTVKNDSGVEPVAANRIYTGTGADVTYTNNPGVIQLIYDGGSSRWVLISKSL